MQELVASPPPPVAETTDRVAFTGRRAEYRRLVMRGALLELATVGFYRFWLATDMRRHLWSHTSVGGDGPEYTGTAKELLIGFLFAMAILLPIYLAYFFIGLEVERLQAFASIPLFLFFYLFAQFAIYRARRYRLTRTVWRGVRFWMKGSGWNYSWRAALWGLFVLLTLGLALPWRAAALERFKMRHSFYGDLPGRFDATGWQFFKDGWWLWLLSWPAILVPVAFPFVYAAFKSIEWRWWASGIRFGEVRFESKRSGAPSRALVIGWSCCCSLFRPGSAACSRIGMAWRRTKSSGLEIAHALQHPVILIVMALGYVAAALALGVVLRVYLLRDVWERVAASVSVHNLAAADNVKAQGHLVSALGEGFADSLDVAGF
jgi:uncharacterized membrane protein YjgN (DUF898 family)